MEICAMRTFIVILESATRAVSAWLSLRVPHHLRAGLSHTLRCLIFSFCLQAANHIYPWSFSACLSSIIFWLRRELTSTGFWSIVLQFCRYPTHLCSQPRWMRFFRCCDLALLREPFCSV